MDLQSINVSKILIEFKPLIHKTLQRLRIHPQHMNFDDFYQELQIKLVELYKTFEGDPLRNEVERYKFTSFAGNGMYWRGIDLFKKRSFNTLPILEDEHLTRMVNEEEVTDNLPEKNVFIEEFFKLAKERLSESEYQLLQYLAEERYSISEIAEIFDVSRGTIYNRKNKMLLKIQDLKECLA